MLGYCRRALIVIFACLALLFASAGGATASTVPADLESHVPLLWNPLFGVNIHNVYWDSDWDARNPGFSRGSIDAAVQALTKADYFERTAQYGVPARNFTGHSDALGVCGSDPGTSISQVAVYAFMTCETTVPLFGLPDGIYNVFVPSRTTIDNGMCTSYRAYHTLTGQLGVPPTPVYFAVIPLACYSNVASLMSGVSHEDAEILTDPAVGLGWYDTDSAPQGFPSSLFDLIDKAIHDPVGLIQIFMQMHSEAGDICEASSPYPGVPGDFASVPSTPYGIDMELASYWSNQDHACVIGDSRVVEASFQAVGLPAGAGSVLVDNYLRPIGYTHSIRENVPFTFDAAVTVGGVRYVTAGGTCSGTVQFPADSTSPSTQNRTYTCLYRRQGFGTGAIAYSDGCALHALPRNDDGSFGPYPLPFALNFFGTTYASVFVNNNGNVTFDGPMTTYTPFPLTTTNRVVIAPFFGDVDTRAARSSVVTWGETTFEGRRAFCVLWADVGVGYYSFQTDKLNSFQLLLVDRSNGDFDIVMNYDQIQWETGQASGGVDGLGGSSARVGYSNGVAASSLELPGSAVNGALLDSSPSGLVHDSRGSTQLGRYVFPVRNGRPPAGGGIGGQVTDPSGAPVAGALVQVCPSAGGTCVWNGFTSSLGLYDATGIADGVYTVTAFPPAGSNLIPQSSGPVAVAGGAHVGTNIQLEGPKPPPPGTTISPSHPGGDGVPIVYWHDPLQLRTQGCPGGTASYAITNLPDVYALGYLAEGPAGVYTATVPALYPSHGFATVGITIHCPDGSAEHVLFDIYIDPSGMVETTTGQPLAGATVTLYRSDTPTGTFVPVPDGSPIMAPSNRQNPDATDAAGHFGWNVITGYYRVRASHPGCHAPGDASQNYVETAVLEIPPPATNLVLRLECAPIDTVAPTTSASVSPEPNAAGWNRSDVTVTLHAVDQAGGSGVESLIWSAAGAGASPEQTVTGDAATIPVSAEGTTTISYQARDLAGNLEAVQTLLVRLDKTAPTVTCSTDPNALWPPNHRLVAVTASVTVTDAVSGPNGFTLVSATSSEPDDGLGDGDTANDVQDWNPGTADTAGSLRAERSGTGGGRTYTLTYGGADVAENTATCAAAVAVPHDHSN